LLPNQGTEGEAEWKEPLFPWSAVVCLCYALFAATAQATVISCYGMGPRWETINEEEIWHAKVAILLVFSAFITEMCFLASSATNASYLGFNMVQSLQLHRLGDSFLTLGEYATKVLAGIYMWVADGGVAHTDMLAWGGPRPVYLGRFWQWAIAVPILVLISNRSFISRNVTPAEFAIRNGPAVVASFFFVWCAWVMEVTLNVTVRYSMVVLAIGGAVIVSTDQLNLAFAHRKEDLFGWKMTMLIYQIASFAFYASLFLMGRFGLYESLTEQSMYAYCDASVKVFQGAILAMIRNRQDLTVMRKWWIAALAASKDLDNLIQQARVPVLNLDVEGRILDWNSNLEKLTGLKLDDVQGKLLVEVADPTCRVSVTDCMNHVSKNARAGDTKGGDTSVIACSTVAGNFVELTIGVTDELKEKGPCKRQMAMTLVPKSLSDGTLAGFVAIGQDLSDIAELKIIQERKSALMAMLSHEIRSPLHGMMGLTGAMLESEAGKAMERQLGMVKGCAARLLDLVTNIMDLAQHEKRKRDGKPTPRPTTPVNFSAIANEVATMTDMAVDKMNKPLVRPSVRLINNLAGMQVPLILGDQQKCTQLVYNLVTNACKFTEKGTVSINANYYKDKQLLEIDVTDTGMGISKEGQKKIFGAFEQEPNAESRSFQGIGLGLAVCTEIVELHRGQLRVESELGKGSSFIASFPCDGSLGLGEVFDARATPADDDPKPTGEEGEAVENAEPMASATEVPQSAAINAVPLVLSVDDDEVNQEVVRGALSGLCDIYCAMDGNQAVKYLEERRQQNLPLPDTVLLDIQMPGMDGFEVCEEIRQRFEAQHSKMPIIMISAKAPVDQTAIQSFTTGTTDFVPKPFNTEVLRKKVQVVLKAKRDFDLGASTSVVAKEAYARLKEMQTRVEEEQSKTEIQEKACQKDAEMTKELEEKLSAAEKEALEVQKEHEAMQAKLEELEKLHRQEIKQQEEEAAARAAKAAKTADDAVKEKASREAALKAEQEHMQAAIAQREEAEKKAKELADKVQTLQEKLAEQERIAAAAPPRCSPCTAAIGSLPVDAIKAATAAAVTAACAEGEESEAQQAMELQHQLIGALLRQTIGASAIVRALRSRIDILNALARGCFDLLRLPLMAFPLENEPTFTDPAMQEGQFKAHLEGFDIVAQILTSQFALMDQVSSAPKDLAGLAQLEDTAGAELVNFGGEGVADFSPSAMYIGA